MSSVELVLCMRCFSTTNYFSIENVSSCPNFWYWCIPQWRYLNSMKWQNCITQYSHTNIVALQYIQFSCLLGTGYCILFMYKCVLHAFLQGSRGPSSILHLNPVAAPTAWNSTAAWVRFTTKPALIRFTLQVVEAVGMYTFQDTSAFSPTAVVAVTRRL